MKRDREMVNYEKLSIPIIIYPQKKEYKNARSKEARHGIY